MSEIRKQKKNKREKLTWAPPCAAQPSRPSTVLARASQLLPLARAGREVSMARPSSPRTTQPLCIALVAVAPRGSSSGRRPDLADTPFTLPRFSLALSLSRPNTTVAAVRRSH